MSEFEQRVQAAIDAIPVELRLQPCSCAGKEDRYCDSDGCPGRLLGFRLALHTSDMLAKVRRPIIQGPPSRPAPPRGGPRA